MTSIITVFIVILTYDYYTTRQSIIKKAEDYTNVLSDSVINKINIGLSSVKKISEELAYTIEFTDLNENEMKNLLKGTVENTPEIYGCTVAFEPHAFDSKKYYYDPYYYKPQGVAKFFDSGNDAEYDYFKWPWYTVPKRLNKGVWSEPYFDEGGGNIRMVHTLNRFIKS